MTSTLPFDDVWMPLTRKPKPLTTDAKVGPVASDAVSRFDYTPTDHPSFTPWEIPDLPTTWGVGVIVGASGTGKSTMLREFGEPHRPVWDRTKTIADHFDTSDVEQRFYAVGLSSVPTWLKPYHVLSNGEAFRADLARSIGDGALIDEFTSVVDRTVAQAASRSLGKWVRTNGTERMVVATVHRDVLPWLEPDWIIDTETGMWSTKPRECLQRRPMVVDVYEVERTMWAHFMGHHYLTPDLHPFARCYLATLSGTAVAFAATIPFPHGRIRNGWRGTRLVTLPDFQGLGVGPRLSDWVAEAHTRAGYSYYVKTTHPRLGEYRDRHPNWTPIGNRNTRTAAKSFSNRKTNPWVGSSRPSYSHRYTLDPS